MQEVTFGLLGVTFGLMAVPFGLQGVIHLVCRELHFRKGKNLRLVSTHYMWFPHISSVRPYRNLATNVLNNKTIQESCNKRAEQ